MSIEKDIHLHKWTTEMVSPKMIISKFTFSLWRVIFLEAGEGKQKEGEEEVHTSLEYNSFFKKNNLKHQYYLDSVQAIASGL